MRLIYFNTPRNQYGSIASVDHEKGEIFVGTIYENLSECAQELVVIHLETVRTLYKGDIYKADSHALNAVIDSKKYTRSEILAAILELSNVLYKDIDRMSELLNKASARL